MKRKRKGREKEGKGKGKEGKRKGKGKGREREGKGKGKGREREIKGKERERKVKGKGKGREREGEGYFCSFGSFRTGFEIPKQTEEVIIFFWKKYRNRTETVSISVCFGSNRKKKIRSARHPIYYYSAETVLLTHPGYSTVPSFKFSHLQKYEYKLVRKKLCC